jgi:hypothetical protein
MNTKNCKEREREREREREGKKKLRRKKRRVTLMRERYGNYNNGSK